MEQITEKLFESVRNYFSEGVLDFSSLDEYRFYFVTENGKILFGISGWLKHLFTDELRFIALASEYGDVLVTQSSAVVFTWKFKKCDGNAIVVVQKKGNVNCSYKDHLNIFRTIEDFVIDLAEQGCREKKFVNLNLAEALVESENVCLYMDSDSSKYIDGEKRCKPYVHEANRAPLSYGNAVSFSGASRFFVTTEYKTATKPYYLQKTYGCRAGYFSQLTSEELEKICSYSKHVKNLLLEYVTKNFQTSVPAAEVYKRILKRKETISTIPDFAKETADGFERQFLLRKKNRGRKLTAVAASVGAAVMGIVIGTYCLVRNPFVTGESFSSSTTISSYNGHKSKVELPSCVRILATRTVGKKAFAFKSLKSLSMADTYYYIRESAFMSCRKLSEVKLSANLREIDEGAFSGCSISEISIPPTVYYLGDCVFEGNPLKKITVGKTLAEKYPQSLEKFVADPEVEIAYIDDSATFRPETYFEFSDGGKTLDIEFFPLENLNIPAGVEKINISSDFCTESKFKTVTLPEGLDELPESMFSNSMIEEIVLPDSLEEIPYGCFAECKNLKKVHLGKNLRTIGVQAFYESVIEEIEIPDTVEKIPSHCFSGCNMLKKVTLGSGIKSIDEYSFCESALESINLPDSLAEINMGAFCYTKLTDVKLPPHVKKVGDYSFNGCYSIEKMELNDELEEIGFEAIQGIKISEIRIPPKIEKISWAEFQLCSKLKTVYVASPDTKLLGFQNANFDVVVETGKE